MRTQMKNAIFPLIAGGVLICTLAVAGVTSTAQNSALQSQRDELASLTDQIKLAHATTTELEESVALDPLGARSERVEKDAEEIEAMAAKALTWDSHASYEDARASTMRLYDLSEKSSFIKSFLPEAPVNYDSQGNAYPYIDAAGLNSRIGSTSVKLLEVNGTDYSYMALVDVQAVSSDGLGTAVNVATIFATVDGDGGISELSGFASTSPVRSAD